MDETTWRTQVPTSVAAQERSSAHLIRDDSAPRNLSSARITKACAAGVCSVVL